MIIQARYQARRDRTRLAVEAAIEDYKGALEISKRSPTRVQLAPLSAYMHFHAELLEALDTNRLTPETMREINKRKREILDVIREHTDEGKANS